MLTNRSHAHPLVVDPSFSEEDHNEAGCNLICFVDEAFILSLLKYGK